MSGGHRDGASHSHTAHPAAAVIHTHCSVRDLS